ncbi:MAG: hypothetical protein OEY06_12810 [Gammaproteobacteria bacterium]|nr:hypothetical protein [Gammaproteobacteria bacterium]
MTPKQMNELILKISQVLTFLVGVAFTTYNLFSFKGDKSGYFFHDDNQLWLSFGICFLAIAYVIKNWKKL